MEQVTLTDTEIKIFNGLKELMMEEEFQQAHTQFLVDNCQKFDDDDENKLEYTNVFIQYLKIVDEILETGVKERFQVTD